MKAPLSQQPDELQAFLEHKHKREDGSAADHARLQQEWVEALERLYTNIETLLAESVGKGLVNIRREKYSFDEELLGKYEANELVLEVNREIARFIPKGRMVVGANGRVDLVGELDHEALVLDDNGEWVFLVSRIPWQTATLDASTLASALRKVMR